MVFTDFNWLEYFKNFILHFIDTCVFSLYIHYIVEKVYVIQFCNWKWQRLQLIICAVCTIFYYLLLHCLKSQKRGAQESYSSTLKSCQSTALTSSRTVRNQTFRNPSQRACSKMGLAIPCGDSDTTEHPTETITPCTRVTTFHTLMIRRSQEPLASKVLGHKEHETSTRKNVVWKVRPSSAK